MTPRRRPSTALIGASLLAAALLGEGGAAADDAPETPAPGSLLEQWYGEASTIVDAWVEEHRIKPPQKRDISWRAQRLGRFDLKQSLLQLAMVDVDGDGVDELFALGEDTLFRLSSTGEGIVQRHELQSPEAHIRPRWPMGSLYVLRAPGEAAQLVLRSSRREHAVRVSLSGGEAWNEEPVTNPAGQPLATYPICEGVTIDAVEGRAELDASAAKGMTLPADSGSLQSASCGRFVAPSGQSARFTAWIDDADVLRLRCSGNSDECWEGSRQFEGAGYAHHIVDLDTDGHPEVVMASVSAPRGRDRVVVMSHTGTQLKRLFDRSFSNGIVAIGSGDLDGDGAVEVVVAHRGANRGEVELWRLN